MKDNAYFSGWEPSLAMEAIYWDRKHWKGRSGTTNEVSLGHADSEVLQDIQTEMSTGSFPHESGAQEKVRMEKYEEKYKGVICTLINEVIGIDKIVQEEQ